MSKKKRPRLELGDVVVDGITLIFGMPNSGKTKFLLDGAKQHRALYVPPHFYLLEEAYDGDAQFLWEFEGRRCSDACNLSQYYKVAPKLGGQINLAIRGGRLYQEGGRPPPADAAKIFVLELLFRSDAVEKYEAFFLDRPSDGMHPMYKVRLALLLHTVAAVCRRPILVVTHDVFLLDALNRAFVVLENLDVDDEEFTLSPVRYYLLSGGRFVEYDPISSYLRYYTKYLYAPYTEIVGAVD